MCHLCSFFYTEEGQVCVRMISSPGILAQLPSGKERCWWLQDKSVSKGSSTDFSRQVFVFCFFIWPGNRVRNLFQLIVHEKGQL